VLSKIEFARSFDQRKVSPCELGLSVRLLCWHSRSNSMPTDVSHTQRQPQTQTEAMAEFGSDPLQTLNETHLVESTRFVETNAAANYVAFTLKKYSLENKTSHYNLFLHNSQTLQTKQMTRLAKGGICNPHLLLDIPGAENSILYLLNGQIWSLPIDGGEERP
jgi:hypothetical protein